MLLEPFVDSGKDGGRGLSAEYEVPVPVIHGVSAAGSEFSVGFIPGRYQIKGRAHTGRRRHPVAASRDDEEGGVNIFQVLEEVERAVG